MAATTTTKTLSARWVALTCPALCCAAAFAGGGPVFETDTLDHPEPTSNQNFGARIGLAGTLAIVGSPTSTPDGGEAFIFERSGGEWGLAAMLATDEPEPGNDFGRGVDIETPYAAVGAPNSGAGVVYMYEDKLGEGWLLRDTITPSDASEGDAFDFGQAVARSGNITVVGAPSASGGGRVYVFRRNGDDWVEEANFQGDDTASGNAFGSAVDIDGNRIIVGAPNNAAGGSGSGRIYIFEYTDEEGVASPWQQIFASTPAGFDTGDALGTSVAISGPYAVAGAPFSTPDGGPQSGSVALFADDAGWAFIDEFNWSASTAFNGFGGAVALDRGQLLVGAVAAESSAGVAYHFVLNNGVGGPVFAEEARLKSSDAGVIDLFGSTLAISGDTALVGAPSNDSPGANVGRAYIYEGLFDAAECPGDLNGDLTVNSTDLNMVLAAFASSGGGDADGDGDTDSSDLNIVLANFGDTCFPDPQ